MTAIDISTQSLDRWHRRDRIFIALLVFCTFALYFRTAHFEFIGYDDQYYVYANSHVQNVTLSSFRWAMTAIFWGNWHPLTLLVDVLISAIFGVNAGAYHLVNSLLHTLNVVLLYAVLRSCTGKSYAAFFTAAFWGLHPLRAESVAWVSELKDVLCGALSLGCLLAYVQYSIRRTWARYSILTLLFVLALLAKPMAATLPGMFLLLDYWPLRQPCGYENFPPSKWWRNRILEKLPLAILSIADLTIALFTQRTTITRLSIVFPVLSRIENAFISTVIYLRDIFFPYHLSIFYPHPIVLGHRVSVMNAIFSAAVVLLISVVVILRRRKQPYLTVGWLWFLGMLVPVIGFVQVGPQSHADRYTYLPSIGIAVALVWWISDVTARRRGYQTAAVVVGAGALAALAAASVFAIGRWQNSTTLFEYAQQVVPDNYLAASFRCTTQLLAGNIDAAITAGREATTIAPGSPVALSQYSLALAKGGRFDEAVEAISSSLNIDPSSSDAWDVFGRIRDMQADQCAAANQPGETDFRKRSIIDLKCAVQCDPDNLIAADHLAYQYAVLRQLDDAIPIWNYVLTKLPTYAPAHGELGDALRLKGDLTGAVEHYQAALAAGSKNPDWETELAYLVATNPQTTLAQVEPMVAIAKDACDQTHNRSPLAMDAYAACLARVGRFDDAVSAAQQAVAQANADHSPGIAQGIQKRLSRYQRGLSYVAGDQ